MQHGLKFGLNVVKKPNAQSVLRNTKNVFGSDDDENEGKEDAKHINISDTRRDSTNFECQNSDGAYSYDSVYDQIKAPEKLKRLQEESDKLERKPKYIHNLIEASQKRKMEHLLAKEKNLQTERDLDADKYNSKESFITGAYKKHRTELSKIEDANAESANEMDHYGDGINSIYRRMLDEKDKQFKETILAINEAPNVIGVSEDKGADVASILNTELVQLNELGEPVDKRQLLAAGLNTIRKYNPQKTIYEKEKLKERPIYNSQNASITHSSSTPVNKSSESLNTHKLYSKSKKTKEEIESARERYLKRKANKVSRNEEDDD